MIQMDLQRQRADKIKRYVLEEEGAMFNMARGILGNTADAHDAVQETYINMLNGGIDSYDPTRPIKPWALTLVANMSRDIIRRKNSKIEGRLPKEIGDVFYVPERVSMEPLDQMTVQEDLDEVLRRLFKLPDKHRNIIELFARGNQYPFIAEIEGVPLGTVKSRLGKGREHIR